MCCRGAHGFLSVRALLWAARTAGLMRIVLCATTRCAAVSVGVLCPGEDEDEEIRVKASRVADGLWRVARKLRCYVVPSSIRRKFVMQAAG